MYDIVKVWEENLGFHNAILYFKRSIEYWIDVRIYNYYINSGKAPWMYSMWFAFWLQFVFDCSLNNTSELAIMGSRNQMTLYNSHINNNRRSHYY
jgi:hypothetical protein